MSIKIEDDGKGKYMSVCASFSNEHFDPMFHCEFSITGYGENTEEAEQYFLEAKEQLLLQIQAVKFQ